MQTVTKISKMKIRFIKKAEENLEEELIGLRFRAKSWYSEPTYTIKSIIGETVKIAYPGGYSLYPLNKVREHFSTGEWLKLDI